MQREKGLAQVTAEAKLLTDEAILTYKLSLERLEPRSRYVHVQYKKVASLAPIRLSYVMLMAIMSVTLNYGQCVVYNVVNICKLQL